MTASKAGSPNETAAIQRGVGWLMPRQGRDGGWHSETYGALRDGAAVTALVLYAAGHWPEGLADRHRKCFKRAQEFLGEGIRKKGFVCAPDGTVDYPSYGSAMLLVAAPRLKLDLPRKTADRLTDYLIDAQLTQGRGFRPGDPNYGGWDMLGGTGIRGMTSGTNVSVTSLALEALHRSEHAREAVATAAKWAERCQNLPGDGGFVFHPEPDHDGNKALWRDDDRRRPRSYGTTTCDGLRCLLLSGAKPGDERVRAAVDWLVRHPEIETVPGFDDAPDHAQSWNRGLWYYYAFALSRVLPLLPKSEASKRQRALAAALIDRQHDDGRWQNTSARMREDDPLIATCFALIALAAE